MGAHRRSTGRTGAGGGGGVAPSPASPAGAATREVCGQDVRCSGYRALVIAATGANARVDYVTAFLVESCVAARRRLSPEECMLFRTIVFTVPGFFASTAR